MNFSASGCKLPTFFNPKPLSLKIFEMIFIQKENPIM
jgi:hypothetical protein